MAMIYVRNQAGYRELTISETGAVQRHMRAVSNLVAYLARAQVGRKTGRLGSSITVSSQLRGGGRVWSIGSSNRIALIHHEGTRPHIIRPNSSRVLRFVSRGKIVHARVVHHPGTRPNRYLSDNLRRAVR